MEKVIINYLGEMHNIVKAKQKENKLYVTVKDIGHVNISKLKGLNYVYDVIQSHGKIIIFFKDFSMEEKEMSKDFKELSTNIMDNIGGKENVKSVMHCVTRLRFLIYNKDKVNVEAIKKLDGAMGCQWVGEQFQIIIGANVNEVYCTLCDEYGFEQTDIVDDNVNEENKSFKDKLIGTLTGILMPAMSLIIGGGMIKAIMMMILSLHWVTGEESWFTLLMAIGDAPFYFLPFVLGYSTAKHFNMNPVYGLGIAMGMCYPTIQNVPLDFFGLTVSTSYTSTLLPIIFVVWFGTYVYRFAERITPKLLSSFVVPIITFGVTIPLGFILIGPVLNAFSQVLCDSIMWLYSEMPIVAAIILGLAWQVLVVFGMHSVFSSLATLQIAAGTGTPILSMIFPAFFAQTMTVWAIYFKTKNIDLKSKCMSSGISGLLGVTEPAIYTVTLPRIKYFIISCIGTAGGALVMAITGTLRYSLGGLGFFTFPTFFGEGVLMSNVLFAIVTSLLVAGGISFILTFIIYKDEGMDLENYESVE
ncbi:MULTISPECIES: PTS transporter subunit EIIC [Faecalicoccus]|uniref:PTS transporter subunit EIIC n=1 Tax=Faecalicoccus pleomorphus TaxID=1323 RepID=A0AAW6CWK8_9FIRM|nr:MULTISPECIES: PTS transporter subunit EIIC [Faecalicoccus]MDB7980149.1 PTS transporter subunit EIIC [Faecalicoccus pleomorphus]MDB7982445.1 PTS transporter subunit EIIC [Faecalicoccus pleomorphus]MDB7987714.1 PTS transporter subunit EIIC [Faecalicoccus pleomorphus]MDB7992241.1 PTS transporter subunit EIIC [Faecalicoccus pleomorphus]MDY5111667.1 PTS transporter subunit EIIC [Faecalicoccus sp.]